MTVSEIIQALEKSPDPQADVLMKTSVGRLVIGGIEYEIEEDFTSDEKVTTVLLTTSK